MRRMSQDLSALLLRLYRLAREANAPAFKERAFARQAISAVRRGSGAR